MQRQCRLRLVRHLIPAPLHHQFHQVSLHPSFPNLLLLPCLQPRPHYTTLLLPLLLLLLKRPPTTSIKLHRTFHPSHAPLAPPPPPLLPLHFHQPQQSMVVHSNWLIFHQFLHPSSTCHPIHTRHLFQLELQGVAAVDLSVHTSCV